jgi:tRNA threonylcarbamoyladenosine biosynthesis protein TsaB
MADGRPRLLLIETSGRVGRVGLAEGPVFLADRSLDEARRHARDLAPMTAGLLNERGWRARDLHGIIVSLGPGSYTGLRVGIMSAKALAYATGCAVVGVPTFEVLARQVDTPGLELVVIADAHQEFLYVQPFGRGSAAERFSPAGELTVVSGREWARQLGHDVVVVGPGLRIAGPWLPPGMPTVTPDPSVADLLAVGWERYQRGLRDDPVLLEPLYLRRSSAEEQWDRRANDGLTGCR